MKFNINLQFVFLFAFTLYSIPIEISKFFYNSIWTEFDLYYLFLNIVALLGFTNINKNIRPVEFKLANFHYNNKPLLILLSLFIFSFFMFRSMYYLDFNFANIFKAYLFEGDKFEEEKSTLDVIILFITCSTALFYNTIIDTMDFTRFKSIFFKLPIIIILLFLLARGGRNPVLFFIFPIILSYYLNKKVHLKYVLFLIILLFPFTHFIAVVRNFGIEKISSFSDWNANYDPIYAEFGTPYRVLEFYFKSKHHVLYYGKSILFDPIINLVPIELWPKRPLTIATEFTIENTKFADKVWGLGFSPILEALMNFGIIGVFFWFFLLRHIFQNIDNFIKSKKEILFSYILIFPILINLQRIDFAVCIKIYLIELSWMYVLLFISKLKFV
jgi:oligosaccharide repeat unit polymerase